MKASDLFVKCLDVEGMEYIFGVPGEENADFMMSLENTDNNIKFILCRHEQGAAFMAEIYGRLTGNPAGCLGTLGPGATNLITGVADSNMDRAPMLVLTGQVATRRLHKESHQVMDVVAMFEAAFGEQGPSLIVIPIDYRENYLLTKKLGEITATI